jgi:hypothetical protein
MGNPMGTRTVTCTLTFMGALPMLTGLSSDRFHGYDMGGVNDMSILLMMYPSLPELGIY